MRLPACLLGCLSLPAGRDHLRPFPLITSIRIRETLTFLSLLHSLRQQKPQKNKPPTMTVSPCSSQPRLVHSTPLSKQNSGSSQNERARKREREGGELPTPLPLSSFLKRCHCSSSPSPLLPTTPLLRQAAAAFSLALIFNDLIVSGLATPTHVPGGSLSDILQTPPPPFS